VTQASHRISAPDFASYPYNSVPDAVNRIYRALDWHARKQRQHRSTMTATERASTPAVDLLRPIIADADAGHGGPTSVAQLVQLFIEAGAAGVHLEDQRSGSKRCGHMAGKVLVSTGEHVRRLQTARLQADVMRAGLVLIARTDAEGAMWLDSDEDARDHVFLLGGTSERQRPQRDVLREAEAGGARPETVERLLRRWQRAAGVCTYPACVRAAIEALADDEEERVEKLEAWDALVATLPSLAAMRARASDLLEGEDPWWCAEQCRSAEGFYRITGGEAMCVARARAYAPYADLLWMETKAPLLPQAARFAEQVRSTHPSAMFVYNFSPSFNWAAAGLDEKETAALGPALAKLGYVLQLVSLAGFHVNTLGMGALAKDYAENGVTAYVRQVQQKEAKLGLDTLTHQRWSGAMLTDDMLVTVFGAGTSKSMDKSDANTETQFEPQGQREVVDDGRQES
jgi:isocitrate lyase